MSLKESSALADLIVRLRGMARGEHDDFSAASEAADVIEAQANDVARLDWLADPANTQGQVLLPRACVEQNIASLRHAIDAAMVLDAQERSA